MTNYEFTALDINERANLLWEKGIFLDRYRDNEKGINLYYLHNFYVEVTISNNPTEEIIDISPFKNGIRFEKYLDKINLLKILLFNDLI